MKITNFEFKAAVETIVPYEKIIKGLYAEFIGIDHQTDTYFDVPVGRLKLREGNIENALISYNREDVKGAKKSEVDLFKFNPDSSLKTILRKQFKIKISVEKVRKIYFIGNVKFHFDEVKHLGRFLEVEAIDNTGQRTLDELKRQCLYFMDLFGLDKNALVAESYSDLLIRKSVDKSNRLL